MATKRKSVAVPPERVTRGDVLDDLGLSPKMTASIRLKAELHDRIIASAARHTQQQLQAMLQESQPRVSDLLRGKLSKFSLEMLLFYAAQLGIHAEITTSPAKKNKKIIARAAGSPVQLARAQA